MKGIDYMKEGLEEYQALIEGRRIIAARAAQQGMLAREYLRERALRRRAKALALAKGLAYWPALIDWGTKAIGSTDPVAFVIAERVLARREGALWGETLPDGSVSHGGWDSYGCHGISPATVVAMWRAAGCRDSGKFRLQVQGRIVARKGDTLPWLRAFARGNRWVEGNRIELHLARQGRQLSRKATAALGRLSPELRRAALARLLASPGDLDVRQHIRIRDLDWVAVKAAQEALRGGAPRARAALAGNRRAAMLLGLREGASEREIAGALAPAFPNLPLDLARRVALGESPAQLAGGALTRAEAHAWACAGAPEMVGWLADHLGLPRTRSMRVLRWLQYCSQTGRWPALERERIARIPGGGTRAFTALNILDEIQDEDVQTGKDSVEDVLRRSAERLGDAWMSAQMADFRELAPLPGWARRLPRGVRILRTPAELAREGREMQHCVGGYAHAVKHGQCHILALATSHGRSTVELLPNLEVAQHRGVENSLPPKRNVRLMRAFLARILREEDEWPRAARA